jgi:hypothetical protein
LYFISFKKRTAWGCGSGGGGGGGRGGTAPAGEVVPHPADGPAVGHHGDEHADEELVGEFLNHRCSCWRRSSARPSPCASSPPCSACSGTGQFFLLLGCFQVVVIIKTLLFEELCIINVSHSFI